MVITYNKQYAERQFDNFNMYSDLSLKSTNVFWEYYNLIVHNTVSDKNQLEKLIRKHKPIAKSKLRINFEDNGIEFFKENKCIFPEFHIIFK